MAEKLSFVLEVDDTTGTMVIKKFGDVVEETGKKVGKMGSALELIKWDAITSLINKATGAFQKLMEMSMKGAEIIQTEKTFYALANAAGVSGASMLDSMTKASQGTVSNIDLMQGAIEGLRGHLSPDMIEKLTSASLTFAAAAGTTVKDAFQALMTVIETGRMRQLAGLGENFRMVNVAMTNYATALGKNSAEEMSATQRAEALFSILGQLSSGLAGANVKLDEHFIAIQQAKKTWDDFVDTLKKVAVSVWMVIDGLKNLSAFSEQLGNFIAGKIAKGLGDILPLGLGKALSEWGDKLIKESQPAVDKITSSFKAVGGIWASPTDIAGRGILPPTMAGKPTSTAGVGKSWVEEQQKQYAADIANLQLWAEQQKMITQGALSELDVMRSGHLVSEGEYIDQRAAIEEAGTKKLIQNVEDEKTTTIESYASMEATLAATVTKNLAERQAVNAKIASLVDDRNKKIADLTKKGVDLEAQLQKEGNQKIIAERELTDRVLLITQENRLNAVKGLLEQETKVAQAQAGAGMISTGQAQMIEYQNQVKTIDAEIAHQQELQTKGEADQETVLGRINKLIDQRNTLEKTAAITLKSQTAPAYEGIVDGLQKYASESSNLYNNLKDTSASVAKGIESDFANAFASIFDKTKSTTQKMQSLFQSLAQTIIQALGRILAQFAVTQLSGGTTNLGGGTSFSLFGSLRSLLGLSSTTPTATEGVPLLSSGEYGLLSETPDLWDFAAGLFAKGGITGPLLAHYPLRSYQFGGIANTPQLGVFGEGGGAEAFVPLQHGSIPVKVKGEGKGDMHITNYIMTNDVQSFRAYLMANRDLLEGISLGATWKGKRFSKTQLRG